jgi:hypothetical protein
MNARDKILMSWRNRRELAENSLHRVGLYLIVERPMKFLGRIRAGVEFDQHPTRGTQKEAGTTLVIEDAGFGFEAIRSERFTQTPKVFHGRKLQADMK